MSRLMKISTHQLFLKLNYETSCVRVIIYNRVYFWPRPAFNHVDSLQIEGLNRFQLKVPLYQQIRSLLYGKLSARAELKAHLESL